jgi:hypothetical protein
MGIGIDQCGCGVKSFDPKYRTEHCGNCKPQRRTTHQRHTDSDMVCQGQPARNGAKVTS